MKSIMTVGLACGLLCEGQNLTIRLYNLAKAPAETIDRASAVAGQVLAHAGVSTIWQDGVPDSQEGWITDVSAAGRPTADTREYLVVRIVTGIPPHFCPRATGYALPFARQGVHVTLFYDRIEKLSVGSIVGPSTSSFLGAAMAHEIGHVLLSSAEHSAQGVMKGNWGPSEFRLIACRGLHFTPENAAALRAGAAERLAIGQIQKAPPPTLVLPVTASESYRRSLHLLPIDASR